MFLNTFTVVCVETDSWKRAAIIIKHMINKIMQRHKITILTAGLDLLAGGGHLALTAAGRLSQNCESGTVKNKPRCQ